MRKLFVSISVCLLLLVGVSAMAQSINSGDIRGTVTDPTGAVIPGVTITVLNVDTGVSKDITTNSSGLYDTNSIVPGHYTLTFTHTGFAQLVRGPVTLEIGFYTVNAQLKVGSESQSVKVTTDVQLLQTESAEQSTTLDARSMDELPQLQNRSWENLVLLLPGASGTSATPNSTGDAAGPGQGASINGNLPYSSYLADGASTTLPVSTNTYASTFENIAELQVNTSTFSAQYGSGGAVFNTISKGGTDKYHGTIYDYNHTNLADANPYEFGAGVNLVQAVHYNNYGASVGGPVPFVKKAFFYINYDETTYHAPSNAGSGKALSTPTDAILTGNFGGLFPVYDPTTQVMALDTNNLPYPVRQSFASENGGQNVIPTALQSTVAKNFAKFYPTSTHHPNGVFIPGTYGNSNGATRGELLYNFLVTINVSQPIKKEFGRLDYDITSKNRITMTSSMSDQPFSGDAGGNIGICPIGCVGYDINDWNNQITDVWTINDKFVNELRLGYTYQYWENGSASFGKGIPAALGWQYAQSDDLPDIAFGDGDWNYAWITKQAAALQKQHVYDPSDVVTIVTGRHILHLGGEYLIYKDNAINSGSQNSGSFGFGSSAFCGWGPVCGTDHDYTAHWNNTGSGAQIDSNTGWAFGDFLLGLPAHWNAGAQPEYGAYTSSPQIFVQDDYKIRPNLTLNIGLRYQISNGWQAKNNNIQEFDPGVTNPATGTLGATWYAANGDNGRKQQNKNVKSVFLPRLGFAWAINPRTTIRGGYGLYAFNWSLASYGGGVGSALGTSGSWDDAAGSQSGGISPIVSLDGTGSLIVPGGVGSTGIGTVTSTPITSKLVSNSTNPAAFNGQGVSGVPYETPVPKIEQWNLSIQRQISANFVAEVAYVASHSFNLAFPMNLNQIPASQILTTGVNTAAIPYPQYGAIGWDKYNAMANYNSLQAQITKRLANGMSFNFNYVWSHMLDEQDSSGGLPMGQQPWQNGYNPRGNYGNSNFDVRHAFKGNFLYQLPFGKGKQFMNKSLIMDEVAGGWEFSTTVLLSTGNPFFVNSDQNTYANGTGEPYPNWSGISMKPVHRTLNNWINPRAFLKPLDGTFGNVGRNVGTAPGINMFSMSAHKDFMVWHFSDHDVKLQIRMDAYNAFNHPSFAPPGGALGGSAGAGTEYTTPIGINNVTVGGRIVNFEGRLNF